MNLFREEKPKEPPAIRRIRREGAIEERPTMELCVVQ